MNANYISMPLEALALPGEDGQPKKPAVGDKVDLTGKVVSIDGANASVEIDGAAGPAADEAPAEMDEAALRQMAADGGDDRDGC